MTKNNKKLLAIKNTKAHDSLFKEVFHSCFAQELFRLCMSKKEFSIFDWDSLKPEKDTFKDLRADLVFSVAFKGGSANPFKMFFLLEHKSQSRGVAYSQILKYKLSFIIQNLNKKGEVSPLMALLFYHGKKPWPEDRSLKKGLWKKFLSKIPLSLQKSMLDCDLRIVDTNHLKVKRAIGDKTYLSRGFLNLLKKSGPRKATLIELKKDINLFNNWPGDKEDLLLSVGDYLWATVKGMTKSLWKELEWEGIKKGIFNKKGGYMNVRERIKEEGWQEGMQEGMQEKERELVLNLLKKDMKPSFISEVTGLSETKIKKLKNGKA